MKLNFLFSAAGTPLTKTITAKRDGTVTKSAYPNVALFNSATIDAPTPLRIKNALVKMGEQGACLVKGNLTHELSNERRRGSTTSGDTTRYVVFDLDGVATTSSEAFIKTLPIPFHNVDYVQQWSASAGLTEEIRSHLFFMLNQPIAAPTIKTWLMEFNLTNEDLSSQISLGASGHALLYPLDITINQNDKLIYIAAPKFFNMCDPIEERITLIKKAARKVDFDFNCDRLATQAAKDRKIAELREAKGLPRLKPRFKTVGPVDVISNPAEAEVTEVIVGEEFTRLNLNGGDSLAYWHPNDNYKVLYSFKGEPPALMSKIAPDYFAMREQEQYEEPSQPVHSPNDGGVQYIAFIDGQADCFFYGYWDPANHDLEIFHTKNQSLVSQYLAQNGVTPPEVFPFLKYQFEFDNDNIIDLERGVVNSYVESAYLREASPSETVPPEIMAILSHICGDCSDTVERFLNWLAYIVQRRRMPGTAWVFQGTTGTGKGTLFHKILSPLFGRKYTTLKTLSDFLSDFESSSAESIITMVDEADATDLGSETSKAMSIIKSQITEPRLLLKKKYQNAHMVTNYNSLIFTSNKAFPVALDPNDRRFNVAPRQNVSLLDAFESLDFLDALEKELPVFAGYLKTRPVNDVNARHPLKNEATVDMRSLRISSLDGLVQNLAAGNLECFIDLLPDRQPSEPKELQILMNFESTLRTIITSDMDRITRDEATTLIKYGDDKCPVKNKFTTMVRRITQMATVDIHFAHLGGTKRGYRIPFTLSESGRKKWEHYVNQNQRTTGSNVIRLKTER